MSTLNLGLNPDVNNLEICLENETMPHFYDIDEDSISNFECTDADEVSNVPKAKAEHVPKPSSDGYVQLLLQQLEAEKQKHSETAKILEQLILDHEELMLKYAAAENTIDSWRFSRMCLNETYEKPAAVAISTSVEIREVVKQGSVYYTSPKTPTVAENCYNQPDDEIHSCSHHSSLVDEEKSFDKAPGSINEAIESRLTEDIFLKRAKHLEETIVQAAADVTTSPRTNLQRVERRLIRFKSRLQSLKNDADNLPLVYESPWDIVGKISTIEESLGHLVDIIALVKSRISGSDGSGASQSTTSAAAATTPNSAGLPSKCPMHFISPFQHTITSGLDVLATESCLHSSASTIAQESQDFCQQWDHASNENPLHPPHYTSASILYQRSCSHESSREMLNGSVAHSLQEASRVTVRSSKVTVGSHQAQRVIQVHAVEQDNYKTGFPTRKALPSAEKKKSRHYFEDGILSTLNKLVRKSSRTEQRSGKLLRMF